MTLLMRNLISAIALADPGYMPGDEMTAAELAHNARKKAEAASCDHQNKIDAAEAKRRRRADKRKGIK